MLTTEERISSKYLKLILQRTLCNTLFDINARHYTYGACNYIMINLLAHEANSFAILEGLILCLT